VATTTYSSQTCGGTHWHLFATIFAMKGLAGSIDTAPMTGHEATGHGPSVGGFSEQQSPCQA